MEDKNSEAMGSGKTPGENSSEDKSEATVEDLEEYESLNNEIESLNSVLDTMESNVDSIKDQLMAILMSNREILKELQEENLKGATSENNESKDMETP